MDTNPKSPEPTKEEIIAAMRKYGGGFIQALAEACARADSSNLQIIKTAFPDYWRNYAVIAATKKDSTPE